MGFFIVPDIFHKEISSLMENSEFARVYLDGFLFITLGSFGDHSVKVKEVMNRL